jgi:tetratricopeptide (TPR) repeat protein
MKFIIPIIVLVSVLVFPKDVQVMMKQANEMYRNGKYDSSIVAYKQIEKEGYEGASLYYNLGNSFFRIGKVGYSILNYEKALKLSPTDEDVKHNLAFANISTLDKIQPLPEFFLFVWWDSMLSYFTVNSWTYIVYSFFILLLIFISLYFFVRTIFQQKLVLFSGLGILVILALTISLLIVKINREQTMISGVVVEQSVTAKTSPDSKSGDAFIIHEGLKVNLEDKLDQWIKIKLADGKIGWVENNSVEKI